MIDLELKTFLQTMLTHHTQELTHYWLAFFNEEEQASQHRYYADFLAFFADCVAENLQLHTPSSQALFNFMVRLSELIGEEAFYNFRNSVYTCYLKFPIFQLMEEQGLFTFKRVAILIAFFESLTSRIILAYLQKKRQMEEVVIRELQDREAPMSVIGTHILMVSMLGTIDPQRIMTMIDRLLEKIEKENIKHVIIDINALFDVDTETAHQLTKLTQVIHFMGVRPYLAGMTKNVAKNLTYLNINFGEVPIYSSTKDALQALNHQKRRAGMGIRAIKNVVD